MKEFSMVVSANHLIEKISQLPPDQLAEVNDFVDFLRERRPKPAPSEPELISSVRELSKIPSPKRYDRLVRKRQDGTITAPEMNDLIQMTEALEARMVERTQALATLAQLWGCTLTEALDRIGIKAPAYV
jgi:hypothetical protein